jgi:hypothetical protein
VVVRAATAGDPYRTETQRAVIAAIDAGARRVAESCRDTHIDGSGVILHAAAAASKAQDEISIFGGIDLAAVILIIVLVFECCARCCSRCDAGGRDVRGNRRLPVRSSAGAHPHVDVRHQPDRRVGRLFDALLCESHARRRGQAARHRAGSHARLHPLPWELSILLIATDSRASADRAVLSRRLVVACAIVILCIRVSSVGPCRARYLRGDPIRLDSSRDLSAARRVVGARPLLVGATLLGLTRLETRDDVRALQRPPPALVASEGRVRALLACRIRHAVRARHRADAGAGLATPGSAASRAWYGW